MAKTSLPTKTNFSALLHHAVVAGAFDRVQELIALGAKPSYHGFLCWRNAVAMEWEDIAGFLRPFIKSAKDWNSVAEAELKGPRWSTLIILESLKQGWLPTPHSLGQCLYHRWWDEHRYWGGEEGMKAILLICAATHEWWEHVDTVMIKRLDHCYRSISPMHLPPNFRLRFEAELVARELVEA